MDKSTYWQKQIINWSQSEQTQKKYCTEHRLSYSQFIYWRNRLKQKTTEPSSDINSEDILSQWMPITVATTNRLKQKTTEPSSDINSEDILSQWMPITVATTPSVALTLQINTLQLEFSQQVDPRWLGQVIHELSRVEHQ